MPTDTLRARLEAQAAGTARKPRGNVIAPLRNDAHLFAQRCWRLFQDSQSIHRDTEPARITAPTGMLTPLP